MDDDAAALAALRAPRQNPRWRGHLKVGLIVTLIIEVFILGYLLGRLYGDESLGLRPARHADGQSAARPPAASVRSAPTVQPTAPPSAIASEPEPRRVDAPDRVATEGGRGDSPGQELVPPAPPVSAPANAPSPPAKAPSSVKSPPAAKAPMAMNTPAAMAKAPAGKAPAPVTPAQGRVADGRAPVGVVLGGSTNWFESQSQLRTALREWLVRSGYGGSNAEAEGAEVVLGADGQTAKTRVLVRVAGQAIMREQRWRRASNGWSIADDRQVDPPRP